MLLLLWLVLHTAHTKQPNILFILADDMGYQDVGFRGSDILTPNLDQLAEQGVVLENHYVMPVCAPTRASFLSGRYAVNTGLWRGNVNPGSEWGLGLKERTVAEMLKGYGYSTHMVGKWHVGTHTWAHTPVKRGFDTFMGMYLGLGEYFSHVNPVAGALDCRSDYIDSNATLVDKIESEFTGQYITDVYTQKAVQVIEKHSREKPLFLYLAYTAPHSPWQLPESDHVYFKHMVNATSLRKTYAGMISTMDRGIGQVVQALEHAGLRDNTLIVFCSDNGAKVDVNRGSNYPLRDGKGSLYEGGVRSVSFVNSPLLPKRSYTNKHLHHIIDWFPTFEVLAQDNGAYNGSGKAGLPLNGVNIWDSIAKNISQRSEVLIGKSDSKMYKKVDYPPDECIWDGEKHPKTRSVLRYKQWKILAGPIKDQGWSGFRMRKMVDLYTKNNYAKKGYQTEDIKRPLDWTNLQLFDLDQDPREEKNVASKHPKIVRDLLKRLDKYKVRRVVGSRCSSKGNVNGVWYPWIKDDTPVILLTGEENGWEKKRKEGKKKEEKKTKLFLFDKGFKKEEISEEKVKTRKRLRDGERKEEKKEVERKLSMVAYGRGR